MEQMQNEELPTGETFKGQRVCTHADGGRTRIRRNNKGKRRASKRRGYHGQWREPKLLSIYAVDEEGERINTIVMPVVNDGTFGDVEVFMNLLEMYFVKLGVVHATQVLLVCDGALWIWQRIPALLQKLGVPPEKIVELIDFYHATEHLNDWAKIAFGNAAEAKQWFEKARSELKAGKLEQLLEFMKQKQEQCRSKEKRKLLEKALNYFQEQPQRFAYDKVLAMKLPIGSGAIESLIRQVVNLRLKGNGKFWLEEHAEIMIHGRCQWAAGHWDEFCSRVLTAKLDPRPAREVYERADERAAA